MTHPESSRRWEIVDFDQLAPIPCPCGIARRALVDVEDFPGTLHRTEILNTARLHYHKRITETYYFLECDADAELQLDEERISVHRGMCVLIRPGVRHRAMVR